MALPQYHFCHIIPNCDCFGQERSDAFRNAAVATRCLHCSVSYSPQCKDTYITRIAHLPCTVNKAKNHHVFLYFCDANCQSSFYSNWLQEIQVQKQQLT